MWEEGTIDKRIGKMLYLIKNPKWVIKRHLNQTKKTRYTADRDQHKEEPITVIYDMFDVSTPQPVQQNHSSKQKWIPTGTMEIDPKRQKYHPRDIKFQRGDVVEWLNTPSGLYQMDWLIAINNL